MDSRLLEGAGNRHPQQSRHAFVTDGLRRRLVDGSLAPGMRLPTLRELAEEFKVSTNTVRVAIRALEREGSLYHVQAVGAFVSPGYPGLRPSAPRKTTIALATLDIAGSLEMGIARGVERACQERGWHLQILDAQCDSRVETRNLARLGDSGLRGAIIVPTCDHENTEALFKLKLANYPMVLVDREIPGLKVEVVHSNHEQGARLATEYLVSRGHRQVLMITEKADISSITDRVRGYEHVLESHGLGPARRSIVWIDPRAASRGFREGQRYLGAYEAAWPVLRAAKPPVAFFAHNDYSAWGVAEACRELGLRIPEDVSVVCFDDSDIARAISPPLTTIAQRTQEIGQTAAALLEQILLKGLGSEPRHVMVDVDLIERRSVASVCC